MEQASLFPTLMQQKAAVVEPPSLSSRHCWHCHLPPQAVRKCGHCGKLQEFPAGLNHFEVLGMKVELDINADVLSGNFYRLSKELHPDRFASASVHEKTLSLEWTTALNRAYQTLRDRMDRSKYILELFGKKEEETPSKIPLELADTYFEHQERLESGTQMDLQSFELNLKTKLCENQNHWNTIAQRWAKGKDRSVLLPELQHNLILHRFLSSMILDLNRKFGQGT